MCGGASGAPFPLSFRRGRSPRVRGSLPQPLFPRRERGSIPACAGEPPPRRGSPPRRGVDPRVCGGATDPTQASGILLGRSPRVRGSLTNHGAIGCSSRSIPACAGEPTPRRDGPTTGGVDPRVCGGAGGAPILSGIQAGRSPRVRGSLWRAVSSVGPPRSIPACAGEPAACERVRPVVRVDPRVCGGAAMSPWYCVAERGRSPRVRGSRAITSAVGSRARSIPACAGEPGRKRAR